MIRPATFPDLARVEELIRDMHANSKYAGRVAISDRALGEVLSHALIKQRSTIEGGSFFHVVERDGTVEGFMIGTLARVYLIGKMLVAQDLFLHVSDKGSPMDVAKLTRRYVEWARAIPTVLEVNLSWTDTLPGAEKIGALYQRLGFQCTGAIYSMALDQAQKEAA